MVSTNTTSTDWSHLTSVVSEVSVISYGALAVLILAANLVLLVLVAAARRRRTPPGHEGDAAALPAVVHVAVADLCVGVVLPYLLAVMLHPELYMSSLLSCQALTGAFTVPLHQSLLAFLLLLVVVRCGGGAGGLAPLLAFTWLTSVMHALASALLITWDDRSGCVYESAGNRVYLTANSSLIIAYLVAACIAVSRRRAPADKSPAAAAEGLAVPVVPLLICYCITWIPNCVFTITTTNLPAEVTAALPLMALRMMLNSLIYANSAVKPLIFVYHNRRHLLQRPQRYCNVSSSKARVTAATTSSTPYNKLTL